MRQGIFVVLSIAIVVILYGCGGGGDGGVGTPMTGDEAEFILPSGNAVDSLLASDAVGAIELSDGRSGSVRADHSCRGNTCTLSSATARVGEELIPIESEESLSVSDFGFVDGDWPSSGFKRINGVEFFRCKLGVWAGLAPILSSMEGGSIINFSSFWRET